MRKAQIRPVLLRSPPMQETTNGKKDRFFKRFIDFPMIAFSERSNSSCRQSTTSAELRHPIHPGIVHAVSSETKRRQVLGRYKQRTLSTILNRCEEHRHGFAFSAIDFS